jgi:peptidoglycan/LPS O-acetylase OafA/YrhL
MSKSRRVDVPQFFSPLESSRGVAALVVVVFHAGWTNPITALNFFQNGALMVDFFFVLSGFVIFHSYGRKLCSLPDIARFLWQRLGRLYPLHLAFLLVFLGFELAKSVLVPGKPAFTVNNGHAFIANLMLVHSLGLTHSLTYNYPSWSVSTEFDTYVLFAAVRCLCRDDRQFVAASVLIVVISAATLLRLDIVPLVDATTAWGFFRCCAGFFLGALTYSVYSRFRTARDADARGTAQLKGNGTSWLSPFALVTTIALLSCANPEGRWTYAMPLLSAFVILSIMLWPQPTLQRLLACGPLSWLGRVSYSLYMVHAAVGWVVTRTLIVALKFPLIEVPDGQSVATPPVVGLLVLAGYICLTLVLSHFTYQRIEEPFRKRSRLVAERWFPAGARQLGTPELPSAIAPDA